MFSDEQENEKKNWMELVGIYRFLSVSFPLYPARSNFIFTPNFACQLVPTIPHQYQPFAEVVKATLFLIGTRMTNSSSDD